MIFKLQILQQYATYTNEIKTKSTYVDMLINNRIH